MRLRERLERFVREDLAAALVPWLVARVLVGGSLALARYLFDQVGSGRRPDALVLGLFARDAAFYRDIAEHGYDAVGRSGLRFFPLVSLVARALGPVFAGHAEVALLVVVNLSALLFGALLHRLVVEETGDRALARRAVWLGALAPPLLVLVLGYAEALMMVFAVAMFLALRRRQWEWAAALAVLAGLTRPVGVLLAVPALVAAVRARSGASDVWARVRSLLPVVGAPVGAGIYLLWVGATRGDAMIPVRVQEQSTLRGNMVDPFTSLVDAARDLTSGDRFGSGLHLVWAVILIGLLVVVARRLPLEWSLYAGVSLLVGLSASNLDSFERYGMSTFPFIVGAAFLIRRREVETAVLTLAGGAMMGYGVLVFLGSYVP